jgi:hypothetical protein
MEFFLFATASRPALGHTQSPIQWTTGALSPEVNQLGREADHSLSSSAKVKNAWNYTSAPQYIFIAWYLGKHRDNYFFTSTFLCPWLDDRGSFSGGGNDGIFSLRHRVETDPGAHTASYPTGVGGSYSRVKRPGREADHSHPSIAEVRNTRSYTSTPPVRLHHGVALG